MVQLAVSMGPMRNGNMPFLFSLTIIVIMWSILFFRSLPFVNASDITRDDTGHSTYIDHDDQMYNPDHYDDQTGHSYEPEMSTLRSKSRKRGNKKRLTSELYYFLHRPSSPISAMKSLNHPMISSESKYSYDQFADKSDSNI